MSKKLKKTRIYQEPNYTQKTGYVLADGGANKPTGKLTFEELGKLLGSNPLIIVFIPDGQGSYTMYRQTTFEINVQPQLEPIDFAWLYENVYKVMVCAAIIQGPPEHTGNPIFFFSGMYSDPQTYQPNLEFTRFDTTEDEVVTEHSILVTTDAPYPYTGGTTTITDRNVTIDQSDFEYIIDQTDSSSGAPARIWAKCEAYIAKSLDYRNTHRLMFVESYDNSPYLKYYEYAGKKNGYHYFYRFSPAALLPNGQDEKGLIDVLKVSSSSVWYYHQTGEEFATELWVSNNYVAKVSGKELSSNDYTNADKSTVTLAAAAIPSSASSSNMLTTVTDVEIIAGRTGGYKKVAKNQQGYPDVQDPSNKLIYLTQNDTQSGSNFYDEWLYDSAALTNWELIGSTQMDLTGYATEAWVNQQGFVDSGDLSDYAKEADLQNLADVVDSHADSIETVELDVSEVSAAVDEINSHLVDYATEIWTSEEIEIATSGKMDASDSSAFYPMGSNPSGYLTQHQDLSEYAKTADMNQAILSATSGKMDDSRALEFYPSNNPSGFIDQTYLNGLATEQWVNEHTSAFITSSYLAPYAKTEDLESLSDDLTDFTDEFTVKLDEVSGAVDQVIDAIGDISAEFDEKLEEKMDKDESSAFYPMDSNPAGYLVDEDLEDYATETYVDTGLGNTSAWAKDTFASASQLDDYYPVTNPEGYITEDDLVQADWEEADTTSKSYIQNKPAPLSLQGDSGIKVTETENALVISVSADYAMKGYVDDGLADKVDKVTGMGLSHEDFTSAYKDKLDGIEAGANKNVQPDWEEDDTTSDAFIQNKPAPLSLKGIDGIEITDDTDNIYVGVSGDFATNDDLNYVSAHIPSLAGYATENYVQQQTSGKVDKVTGKDLSTNDFTDALKNKLDGIEDEAQKNVQSDWEVVDTTSDAYIKNKPAPLSMAAGEGIRIVESDNTVTFSVSASYAAASALDYVSAGVDYVSGALEDYATTSDLQTGLADKVDKVTGKGLSTNDYDDAASAKLYGIQAGAEVNVQSDWGQTDNTADDFIKNKPTPISMAAGNGISITEANDTVTFEVTDAIATSAWVASNFASAAQISDMATQTWVGQQDFATNDDVDYVSAALAGYATTSALNDKVDKVPGKGLSTNDYDDAASAKLFSIAPSAEVNVQSDWNETNSAFDSYIANKPDIIVPIASTSFSAPKKLVVVTAMPAAANIDPDTIYLVKETVS